MDRSDAHSYTNVSNVLCDLCLSTFGHSNIAEGFCVNCSHNLCGNCCKYHKTLAVTKNHVVVQDRAIPQKGKPEKDKESLDDKCVVHQGNFMDYYCSACDQFCCCLCVKNTHTTCNKVELITDINDANSTKDVLENLQDIAKELQKNKSKLTSNEQNLKDLKDKARSRINEQREVLIGLFDQSQADFEKTIEMLDSENHSKLKSVSRLHDTLTLDLKSLDLETKNAKKEGKCEYFKAIKKAKKELPLLVEGLKKLDNDNDIDTYQCEVSKKADQVVNHLKELEHIVHGACIRMKHV